MDWSALEAMSATLTTFISLATAILVIRQVREMRKTTHASAFKAAFDILQSEKTRNARRTVFRILKDKPFSEWTEAEREAAEEVCQSFDAVAIMCRRGYVPIDSVADSWGSSLRDSLKIVSPLIYQRRAGQNSKEFWDDYEWLANEAGKYQQKIH